MAARFESVPIEKQPSATETPAFGALSDRVKDHAYLTPYGFIYTSPWVVTRSTTRCSASILLSAKRSAFEVACGDHRASYQAITIRPLLERSLRAEDAQLVSIQVNPSHSLYRRFRAIANPGYLALDRETFAQYDEALEAVYMGKLAPGDAGQLLENIISVTSRSLPRAKRADPRIERVVEMLEDNPNYPLTELAATIGLSYDRMSHLFAEVVGLPVRSFLLWLKIRAASALLGSGMTLTEIALAAGFTDSAHLCNTWQQAWGTSPSYFLNNEYVEVHWSTPPGQRIPRTILSGGIDARAETSAEKKRAFCHHCGSPLHDT